MEIRTITKIALLIFLYYVVYAFYAGILSPIPALGDSWDYHIPIEKAILNGSFANPHNFTTKQYFAQLNPGSAEAFNSLLIFLHVPLTLSNIFAIIALFICCFFLALRFRFELYYALLYATTIASLTAIDRWFNAVSIDVWVAVFFTLAIFLLEKPQNTNKYFFILGIVLGIFVGSKYSAWPFLFVLLIVYGKSLLKKVTIINFLIFLIPFSIFGLFWYVRNFLAVGNPLWPICFLNFPCSASHYNTHIQMWNATVQYPLTMLNAFFGEYKLWIFSFFVFPFIFSKKVKKIQLGKKIPLLIFIGIANFLFLSVAPAGKEPWIMVSSFRYSYPMFIPLILGIFMLGTYYKKESWIGYFAIANMLPVLTMSYFPKLLLIYFPLAILCFYLLSRYELRLKAGFK